MASSSSVQFKTFLFNQVDDIAGNVVSPTEQARGDSGKEPELHRWQNGEKNLGRIQAQSGGQFSSGQTNQQFNVNMSVNMLTDFNYYFFTRVCMYVFIYLLMNYYYYYYY